MEVDSVHHTIEMQLKKGKSTYQQITLMYVEMQEVRLHTE